MTERNETLSRAGQLPGSPPLSALLSVRGVVNSLEIWGFFSEGEGLLFPDVWEKTFLGTPPPPRTRARPLTDRPPPPPSLPFFIPPFLRPATAFVSRRSAFQPGRGRVFLVDQADVEGVFLRDDDGVHPVRREEHSESLGAAGGRRYLVANEN